MSISSGVLMFSKTDNYLMVVLIILFCVLLVVVPYWLVEYFTDNSIYAVLASILAVTLYLMYSFVVMTTEASDTNRRYIIALEKRVKHLEAVIEIKD